MCTNFYLPEMGRVDTFKMYFLLFIGRKQTFSYLLSLGVGSAILYTSP
jgi:hypothetical protein